MENNFDEHYLSQIKSNMQRLDFSREEQEEIIKYCDALKNYFGFNRVFKKLCRENIKYVEFANNSLELLIAYSLRKYSVEYEKKYINGKRPDITINMDDNKILLEIKKKCIFYDNNTMSLTEMDPKCTCNELEDIIYNKKNNSNEDSIMYKFEGRIKNDITIGIIDIRRKRLTINSTGKCFDELIAVEVLKRIMNTNNVLDKEPKEEESKSSDKYDWYMKVKNNLDVVLLLMKIENDMLGIGSFINNSVTEKDKEIVNEIVDEINEKLNKYSYYYLL